MALQTQGRLGLTESWGKQQRNVKPYLSLLTHRSSTTPRLLLAQYTEDTITVYQAYNSSIAADAVRNGNFSDSEFSFSRMTWIKPNFSWMMHRSGWASNSNQERVLAIRLHRQYFDSLLESAVPTSWEESTYETYAEWKSAFGPAGVVIQWDPDHHLLDGARLPYKVLQLGIRKKALDGFRGSGISSITDITDDVVRIRDQILAQHAANLKSLDVETPLEIMYPLTYTD